MRLLPLSNTVVFLIINSFILTGTVIMILDDTIISGEVIVGRLTFTEPMSDGNVGNVSRNSSERKIEKEIGTCSTIINDPGAIFVAYGRIGASFVNAR